MKFQDIIETVTTGAVASIKIPGGMGKITRRARLDIGIFSKKKKKKKKKIREGFEEETVMAGTGVPETSPVYKKSVKKFEKNSLIKKKKKKKSKVKQVKPFA